MNADAPEGTTPAGWYPDPAGSGLRYWDGTQWTEHQSDQSGPEAASGSQGAAPSGRDSANDGAITGAWIATILLSPLGLFLAIRLYNKGEPRAKPILWVSGIFTAIFVIAVIVAAAQSASNSGY